MRTTYVAENTTAIAQLDGDSQFCATRYGCRLRRCRLTAEIRDNYQVYNIPKFDGYHHREQPLVLQDKYVPKVKKSNSHQTVPADVLHQR